MIQLSVCIYQTYFNQITLLTHEDGSAIHKANTCIFQTSLIYATNNSFTTKKKEEILMVCNDFLRTVFHIFYLLSSSSVILQIVIVCDCIRCSTCIIFIYLFNMYNITAYIGQLGLRQVNVEAQGMECCSTLSGFFGGKEQQSC